MNYRFTVKIKDMPGALGKIATAIGANSGNINIVRVEKLVPGKTVTREITVDVANFGQVEVIKTAIEQTQLAEVLSVLPLNDVLAFHRGGKITSGVNVPVFSKEDLSRIYTPGVGEVSRLIHQNPSQARNYTIQGNTIAVVTDGSAVLGLGNIGPKAALPVMEGKCLMLKMFSGLNAWPIVLATQDTREIINVVKNISPGYAAILLEDISAPRCFEIEQALQQTLDIPVVHDDQHQTALVILAALINSLEILRQKRLQDLKVVISGAGAAGIATAKTLLCAGVRNVISCDKAGIIYRGRKENMNFAKDWLAQATNPEKITGHIGNALNGADVFIGLSGPGSVAVRDFRNTAQDFIFFPLANPVPELWPDEINARIKGTGRSDLPNQINNALAFPGFFGGVVDAGSPRITEEKLEKIKIKAAHALANLVKPEELNENYILPNILDPDVHKTVRQATSEAIETLK